MLHVQRETLARMLHELGERELAERALSVTGDDLKRIGELADCYMFGERAMATGGSMGGGEHSARLRSTYSRALRVSSAGLGPRSSKRRVGTT